MSHAPSFLELEILELEAQIAARETHAKTMLSNHLQCTQENSNKVESLEDFILALEVKMIEESTETQRWLSLYAIFNNITTRWRQKKADTVKLAKKQLSAYEEFVEETEEMKVAFKQLGELMPFE